MSSASPPLSLSKRSSSMVGLPSDRWSPRRAEWVLIFLVLLVGFSLRLAVPSRMAVEHFDEGVYASNLAAGNDNGYRYPDRHLYAPPLLPAIIEWSIVFFGPSHSAVMLANLVAGGLTIGLLWWVAGRWFGPAPAIAAATLACFSDIHILYSRTALTDPLLCFWLLAAVFLVGEVYRKPSVGKILAAGAVTGLAWWTKYDGWLALAIGLSGLIPWMLFGRFAYRRVIRLLLCWTGVAVVAMAVWSPVLLGLPQPGYGAVSRNHARYFVGPAGWTDSLIQQFGNLRFFDGPLSLAGLGLAILLACIAVEMHTAEKDTGEKHKKRSTKKRSTWNVLKRTLPMGFAIGLLSVALGLAVGTACVLGLFAVGGLLWELFGRREARDLSPGGWLTAAWFVGLLVGTSLYHPYPRLTLPWLVASWIGFGAAAGAVVGGMRNRQTATPDHRASDGGRPDSPGHRFGRSAWIAAALVALSVAILVTNRQQFRQTGVPGWQNRTGLESIAGRIRIDAGRAVKADSPVPLLPPPIDYVLYVYGEPALFFHLANALANDKAIAQPAANLGFVETHRESTFPVFLVVGPHADRSQAFQQQWKRLKHRFHSSGAYRYQPSDLVLLNQFSADALAERTQLGKSVVRLYRLR